MNMTVVTFSTDVAVLGCGNQLRTNLGDKNKAGLAHPYVTCKRMNSRYPLIILSRPVAVKQLPGPSLPKTDGTV